jgi:hypothetical protein
MEGWRVVRRVGAAFAVGGGSSARTEKYAPTDASTGRLRLARAAVLETCGKAIGAGQPTRGEARWWA